MWGGQRDRKYEQESPKGQCIHPALWLGCLFYPYPHTLGIAHLVLELEAAGAWGWASGTGRGSAELVAPGWGSETFLWVPVSPTTTTLQCLWQQEAFTLFLVTWPALL